MMYVKEHVKKMFIEATKLGDESFATYLFFEYKELFGEYIGQEKIIDVFKNILAEDLKKED